LRLACALPYDVDLLAIIKVWPSLSVEIRSAIVDLARLKEKGDVSP
jgi:6-phosphogluconate dehydrogenase (decarboxylating)